MEMMCSLPRLSTLQQPRHPNNLIDNVEARKQDSTYYIDAVNEMPYLGQFYKSNDTFITFELETA